MLSHLTPCCVYSESELPAAECASIKDGVCRSEWSQANDLLSALGQSLPDCNSFDADGLSCSSDNCKYVRYDSILLILEACIELDNLMNICSSNY